MVITEPTPVSPTPVSSKSVSTQATPPEEQTFTAPASFSQERMWFLDQLHPGSPAYNVPASYRLPEPLDVDALERSLTELVRRHETLRTRFVTHKGQPMQLVDPPAAVNLEVVDLRVPADRPSWWRRLLGRRSEGRDALREAAAVSAEEALRPFDLARGPLIRAKLVRTGEAEHLLLVTLHHIISDGWSMAVFSRELTALYDAFRQGRPSPLPELPIQYVDFAHWQRQSVDSDSLREQIDHCVERLEGVPTLSALPTDRPRPANPTVHGATQTFSVPNEVYRSCVELAQESGATLFMTLLAAFGVVLYRYSGQADFVVASPVAGRTRGELEELIGCFLNYLILRLDASDEPTFGEFLERVKDTALDAMAHQDVPFEQILERLQPDRSLSSNPLYQIMFVLQNVPTVGTPEAMMQAASPDELDGQIFRGTAKLDLSMAMMEVGGRLSGALEYSSDLFDDDSIGRMIGHFKTVLGAVADDPDTRISHLPLLTPEERRQIVVDWNETTTPYPENRTVHGLIAEQAARTPERIAVVFEGRKLTYRQLDERASRLAHRLRALGVGPEVLVAVCFERSLEMLVALYAVLKANGAYVPLEPSWPEDRLDYLLRDVAPRVVLTQERLAGLLPDLEAETLLLDCDDDELASGEVPVVADRADGRTLAYIIFTSGSTGRPKGVMMEHRGVINHCYWMRDAYDVTEADCFIQKHPYSFDVSVWEFFLPLMFGARTVLLQPDGHKDLAYLADTIEREEVTVACFLPSMLQLFLNEPDVARCDRSLRWMLCGAEAMARKVPEQFFSTFDAQLHNLYGPTETCIHVTYFDCIPGDDLRIVPIGRPGPNIQVYLLDARLEPVPARVRAEVYIGGPGVARGYFGNPSQTAERFVPSPFPDQPGERLYRTGDIAQFRPDGNIEFVGRVDHQVKIRGFRVELGEIRFALSQFPGLQDSVVVVREDTPGVPQIVAYLVPKGKRPAVKSVRKHLAGRLPDYMVPSAFVFLEALPFTANDKVSHKELPAPDPEESLALAAFAPPETDAQRALVEVFRGLLRVERIGIHDDFFELGGHSLLATQLVSRIRDRFEVSVSLKEIFQSPTIAALAQALEEAGPDDSGPAIEAIARLPRTPSEDEGRDRTTNERPS